MTLDRDRVDLLSERTTDAKRGPLRPLTIYQLRVKSPGAPRDVDLSGTADQALRHLVARP
jgi:hypothetical protein